MDGNNYTLTRMTFHLEGREQETGSVSGEVREKEGNGGRGGGGGSFHSSSLPIPGGDGREEMEEFPSPLTRDFKGQTPFHY